MLEILQDKVEKLVEKGIMELETIEEPSLNDIKSLEILNRVLTVCIDRRNNKPVKKWTEDLSDEDLENQLK